MIEFYHVREPDAERKGCDDCRHMKAAVSLWCMNKEATEYRGTHIPGVHGCPFWAPGKRWPVAWWKRLLLAVHPYVVKAS